MSINKLELNLSKEVSGTVIKDAIYESVSLHDGLTVRSKVILSQNLADKKFNYSYFIKIKKGPSLIERLSGKPDIDKNVQVEINLDTIYKQIVFMVNGLPEKNLKKLTKEFYSNLNL